MQNKYKMISFWKMNASTWIKHKIYLYNVIYTTLYMDSFVSKYVGSRLYAEFVLEIHLSLFMLLNSYNY